jgi:hypothetical protein
MSINARCGSCNRELLLGQLVQPSNGFRCPVCGFAFAPAYATVAPGVAARVMAAQAVLVTALAELGSMTGDRLRLDRATVVDPVANTLPEVKAKQPALARRRHAHWWTRGAANGSELPEQSLKTGATGPRGPDTAFVCPSRELVPDADTSGVTFVRWGVLASSARVWSPQIPLQQKPARRTAGRAVGAGYWGSSGRTLAAWAPFGPDVTSNSTTCPSSSER